MTPQFLIVKIQAILAGRAEVSDVQKRSIAMQYYKLCVEAEEQIEHCVALIKAGREYPALQVAESSDLLDSLNNLMFAELEQWIEYCKAENLPTPMPFDESQIELVNELYSNGVSQNHPLYRDYRRAMRMRKYDEALNIIKTIAKINVYDAEARNECDKLKKRLTNSKLQQLDTALQQDNQDKIISLYEKLLPEFELIGQNPIFEKAIQYHDAIEDKMNQLRCKEIVSQLRKIDTNAQYEKTSEILAELNIIRKESYLNEDDCEFIEFISKEISARQDKEIEHEKSIRARNSLKIEIETPRENETKADKLKRLTALHKQAGESLEGELKSEINSRIAKLKLALTISRLSKICLSLGSAAVIAIIAYWSLELYNETKLYNEANIELIKIEQSTSKTSIIRKLEDFSNKYPELAQTQFAHRISLLKNESTLAKMKYDRVQDMISELEAINFPSAQSKTFDNALLSIDKANTELGGLSEIDQTKFKNKIEDISEKVSIAIDNRKIENAKNTRNFLNDYEKIAQDYENFAREKSDIDIDSQKLTDDLRVLMEDVSTLFKPHQLDVEKFNEISVRINNAKDKYAQFEALRNALSTSRTGAEYISALESLSNSEVTPAGYARKLSEIQKNKSEIIAGQLVEFATQEGIDKIDSAGLFAKGVIADNPMLTSLYKYTNESQFDVYTTKQIQESTQKWSGGSETIQYAQQVSAGGNIVTKVYRKHFIDGKTPKGELLSNGELSTESKLGKNAIDTASQRSLLEALTVIANAPANATYKTFWEGLIFAKLRENKVETYLEYSPLAKERMQKVDQYSKSMFDYSWIFESISKEKLLKSELYSKTAPDYYKDAIKYVNAVKIALKNPIILVGICDENGKPIIFKETDNAIWAVSKDNQKFERLGNDLSEINSIVAPLSPIFAETISTTKIFEDAVKGSSNN